MEIQVVQPAQALRLGAPSPVKSGWHPNHERYPLCGPHTPHGGQELTHHPRAPEAQACRGPWLRALSTLSLKSVWDTLPDMGAVSAGVPAPCPAQK